MKLSPQQKLITDYLKDGEWHCMATPQFFIKDDRKRISELNQKGFTIEGKPCDGICGIKHSSNVYMRRIVQKPTKMITKVREIEGKYYPYQVPVPLFT